VQSFDSVWDCCWLGSCYFSCYLCHYWLARGRDQGQQLLQQLVLLQQQLLQHLLLLALLLLRAASSSSTAIIASVG
jgi:hypothetical protein